MKDTWTKGLNFVIIYFQWTRLLSHTDASFCKTNGLKSHIGFLIVMADGIENSNIIHQPSSKWKGVTRSVLAEALHALIKGLDISVVIREMIAEIFGSHIPIEGYVNSKSVVDVIEE